MATNIRRAIYGRLAGDTTLNNLLATPPAGRAKSIFHNYAPDDATFPFVLFAKQSGTPTETMGQPSAYETDIWLVKVVDRGDTADTAEAAAARIQTLLNDASLSISGENLMYLRRQSDVEYQETEDGERYVHVGALYRLLHQT